MHNPPSLSGEPEKDWVGVKLTLEDLEMPIGVTDYQLIVLRIISDYINL